MDQTENFRKVTIIQEEEGEELPVAPIPTDSYNDDMDVVSGYNQPYGLVKNEDVMGLFFPEQKEELILPYTNYKAGNIINPAKSWDHNNNKAREWQPFLAVIEDIEKDTFGLAYDRGNQRHNITIDTNKVRPIILNLHHLDKLFKFSRNKTSNGIFYTDQHRNGFCFNLFEYEHTSGTPEYYLCRTDQALLSPPTRIKYVHQLQNLYSTITGKEAFNSFKPYGS